MRTDPDKITMTVDALKVSQPIGDFFVASIDYKTLGKISYFDVRRVLRDTRDVERYLGIQRQLSEKRVTDLSAFVNFLDATFPSSIILAIDDEYAEYDENAKQLLIRNYKADETTPSIAISEVARVLDGQHRIAGLENFKGDGPFSLSVTIFIGSDIADQAYIFSTVNLEQTKVSKSIVYDLFELAKTRSPQKTAHNIAVALDRDERGPFYVLVDQLVDTAMDPYNQQFAQLALFSFHMANSGTWRNSHWPDGKVAEWANELIRKEAWHKDDWSEAAFSDKELSAWIELHVDAEEVTRRKVFTNYRYMLRSAGVLVDEHLQPNDLRQRWLVDAVQLFWDREIFDGNLKAAAGLPTLESALIDNDIYKLLRCSKDQCRTFARAAFAEFSTGQGADRVRQLQSLRDAGAIAA
jgi:DGQHR domain-containing protein